MVSLAPWLLASADKGHELQPRFPQAVAREHVLLATGVGAYVRLPPGRDIPCCSLRLFLPPPRTKASAIMTGIFVVQATRINNA